jgi:hypothetical protein
MWNFLKDKVIDTEKSGYGIGKYKVGDIIQIYPWDHKRKITRIYYDLSDRLKFEFSLYEKTDELEYEILSLESELMREFREFPLAGVGFVKSNGKCKMHLLHFRELDHQYHTLEFVKFHLSDFWSFDCIFLK